MVERMHSRFCALVPELVRIVCELGSFAVYFDGAVFWIHDAEAVDNPIEGFESESFRTAYSWARMRTRELAYQRRMREIIRWRNAADFVTARKVLAPERFVP